MTYSHLPVLACYDLKQSNVVCWICFIGRIRPLTVTFVLKTHFSFSVWFMGIIRVFTRVRLVVGWFVQIFKEKFKSEEKTLNWLIFMTEQTTQFNFNPYYIDIYIS